MLWRPASFYQARGAFEPSPGGGGYSFVNTEASNLVAAFSAAPSDAWKEAYDDFIGELKSGSVWSVLDVMWIMRAPDSQSSKLEAKSAGVSFTLTEVNTPTFTASRGWAGNASSSYLNTGWDPATNGSNLTQNSACVGVYIEPSVGSDIASSLLAIGGNNASNQGIALNPRMSGDLIRGRLNDASLSNASGATATTRAGLTVLDRAASTGWDWYRDGSSGGSATATSATLSSTDIYICCRNNNGSASGFLDNRIGLAFIGGHLDSTKQAALDTAWDNYLTATASL